MTDVDVEPQFKDENERAAKGRARPGDPLAAWCEIGRAGVCTGRAEHRHHRLPRSAGGSDERENTIDCCGACHRLIHDRPSLAYAHGWLLRRST